MHWNININNILFKSKFVEEEMLNEKVKAFKLKDITIEDDIRNIDYINAFMFIIFDHFDMKRMKTPKVVLEDTSISKDDISKSAEEFIAIHFFSVDEGDENDLTKWHTSDLTDILKHNGYTLTSRVLNQKLKSLRIGRYNPKSVRKNGSQSAGYYGISITKAIIPRELLNETDNTENED